MGGALFTGLMLFDQRLKLILAFGCRRIRKRDTDKIRTLC
ncbi:Uncharacterised protein [Vibrio cholerae]|nr:Uncharacterised protein [Vibrio cholerae]